MADFGLFGFFNNYNRPGPGVRKDEPKKPPYIRYFQVMGRKYGKLMQLNLLFLIPVIAVIILMGFLFFAAPVHYYLAISIQELEIQIDLWNCYVVPIPLIFLSPFVAGITYVTRNFAREEHAFVLSDFKDAVKNNWKQFLFNGIFLYFAYILLSFAMIYYYNQSLFSWFFIVPMAICLLLTVVLVFCQFYVPLMIVTFDLKLRQIYRNALIFSIAGLFRNILLVAIFVAMLILMYQAIATLLTLMLLLLFIVLFMFSFISYTTNFVVYSLVERLLIEPYYKKQEEEANQKAGIQSTEQRENEESASAGELDEEDKPEYVYVNGRLRKRSELEDDQVFEDKHY